MSEEVPTRDRRARRRGPGLGSALLGGGLLIALGFGLGVVAGLILEEPDLMLDYAAGRTQAVALEGSAGSGDFRPPAAAIPDVAARPPQAPAAQDPANLPDVARGTPVVDAPAGFAVQVGAFSEAPAAELLARRLRDRGLPVYVAPAVSGEAERWRVRVGPVASREEADQLARRLERDEQLATWVLAEKPL